MVKKLQDLFYKESLTSAPANNLSHLQHKIFPISVDDKSWAVIHCSLHCPFLCCVVVVGYWKSIEISLSIRQIYIIIHKPIDEMRRDIFCQFSSFCFLSVFVLPQPFMTMMHKPIFFCVCFQLYIPIPNVSTKWCKATHKKFHTFCYSISPMLRCFEYRKLARYMRIFSRGKKKFARFMMCI